MIYKRWVILSKYRTMWHKGGELSGNYERGFYTTKAGATNALNRIMKRPLHVVATGESTITAQYGAAWWSDNKHIVDAELRIFQTEVVIKIP